MSRFHTYYRLESRKVFGPGLGLGGGGVRYWSRAGARADVFNMGGVRTP